jgi:N-acetylneuraminic acid mutarotase
MATILSCALVIGGARLVPGQDGAVASSGRGSSRGLTAGGGQAGPIVRATRTPWRLPAPVYRTVAVVSSGRIFVLGGHDLAGGTITDAYRLDPRTGRSARAGSLAVPTHGSAAAVLGGRILVFGGASSVVHDTVQWFHPAGGAATVIGHMPRQRADVTAAVVGRRVVLAGGFDGVGPQSDVWASADGKTFRVVARLPQPVRYPAVAVHGSDVYVFGGLLSGGEYNGTFTNDIQRIHLPTGAATIMGHLPAPLAHAMAAVIGGRMLVIGGSTPTSTSAAILRFDPATNKVSRVGTLPEPTTDAAVARIGNAVYLLGGISSGRPLDTVTVVRIGGAG